MSPKKEESYTAALAYAPWRHRARTVPGLCTSSSTLDTIQGFASIITFAGIVACNLIGILLLLPSIAYSRLAQKDIFFFNPRQKQENKKNISITKSTGSLTAVKTLSARAQMARQGSGGPDYLAPLLLDQTSLFGDNLPGSLLYWKPHLFLARLNFYLTKRIFADQLASLNKNFKFGETALLQVRTCWLDDCVEEFVRRHTKNAGTPSSSSQTLANVVILGAGYDTRCYRFNLKQRGISTYEVDAPATQNAKRRILTKLPIDTEHTKYVPCDFENENWLECLQKDSCGFDKKLPTMFVWEGVTHYLNRETVLQTLQDVAKCGKGSCIGFDYCFSSWALTPTMKRMTQKGGEPWLFGIKNDDESEDLVHSSGLKTLDHVHYEEARKRYLPKHHDGRPVGFLDDFGGLLLAGVV